jgi:hypothetical protein
VVRKYFYSAGWWSINTCIGFFLGYYIRMNLSVPDWAGYAVIGFAVGFTQWLVVRRYRNSGFWIFASALAWGLSILPWALYTNFVADWIVLGSIGLLYGIISAWAMLTIFQQDMLEV